MTWPTGIEGNHLGDVIPNRASGFSQAANQIIGIAVEFTRQVWWTIPPLVGGRHRGDVGDVFKTTSSRLANALAIIR